jgi:uncharacterized protein
MQKIQLPDKKILQEIAERRGVRDIYLFGSYADGSVHEGSDVDIGVVFEKGMPDIASRMEQYGELYADIAPLFKDAQLDLVFLEEAPLALRFRAVAEGELLFSSDMRKACDYLEHTANLYRDFEFFLREVQDAVLSRA